MGSTLIRRKLQCHWFSSNLLCSILEKPEGQEEEKKFCKLWAICQKERAFFVALRGWLFVTTWFWVRRKPPFLQQQHKCDQQHHDPDLKLPIHQFLHGICMMLKVSKSQKQILVFSYPIKPTKIFTFFWPSLEKWSNRENQSTFFGKQYQIRIFILLLFQPLFRSQG